MPRLVLFDLETTGLDTDTTRIVEIAIVDTSGGELSHTYVNPGCPIPADATAVHGITDAMVADAPRFADFAADVQELIEGAVLVTYNGRSFDTIILDRELRRAGQAGIDLEAVQEIDLLRCWRKLEPRTLAGALRRFLNVEHGDAHTALADTIQLPALMAAMVDLFGVTEEELVRISRPEDEVDRSGKLKRGEDGVVRFAFGKHDGAPVLEHRDYCDWMLSKDFPADTKKALRALLGG